MDGENYSNNTNGDNKGLLWLIAIVNILTLILLIGFIIMSWNVITGEEQQQYWEAPSEQGQQPSPEKQQEAKECMDPCIQGGKAPKDCLEECGGGLI